MMYPTRVWGGGHSNERTIIPEAEASIERWELFIDHWYVDNVVEVEKGKTPIYSCCFGHKEHGDNPPYEPDLTKKFTKEEGRQILTADIRSKSMYINTKVTSTLSTFMFGALTSLVFQFGQGRLEDAEKGIRRYEGVEYPMDPIPIISLINKGNYIDAACNIELLKFNRDGTLNRGLKLRRCSEVGFFMTRREKE